MEQFIVKQTEQRSAMDKSKSACGRVCMFTWGCYCVDSECCSLPMPNVSACPLGFGNGPGCALAPARKPALSNKCSERARETDELQVEHDMSMCRTH